MTVVVGFVVCRCRVARAADDPAAEAPVFERVDVAECRELDIGESCPWSLRVRRRFRLCQLDEWNPL